MHYLESNTPSAVPSTPVVYHSTAASSGQLIEYWVILRANFGLVCLSALVGAVIGFVIYLAQSSIYQARTVLDIRSLNENFLSSRENSPIGSNGNILPETYIQTEIKILQSESLKKKALGQLANPQAAGDASEQTSPSFWDQLWSRFDPSLVPFQDLIADAGRRIKVRAVGNTRIVEILCDARDAQLAASVCNSVARTYIEYNLESRYQSTKETGEWLQSQLDDVRKRLTKAENELKNSALNTSAMSSADSSDSLALDKLRQLQSELSRIQAERMARESEYETALTRSADTLPVSMDSGPIRDYRMKLGELKRQLAEARATMTPEHYKVRDLERQAKEVQNDLDRERNDFVNRLKAEYDSAVRKELLLNSAYKTQLGVVAQEGSRSVQSNMLKRDVDSERRLYETLLQKVDEVGLATAMRTSTISVVDPAVPPSAAYSPKQAVDVGVGFFCGSCIGLIISFLRMRSDRSLHGPGEASYHLQLRELGVIPALQTGTLQTFFRRVPLLNGLLQKRLTRGIKAEPATRPESGAVAEAFFATMNSLLFAIRDQADSRIIAITSPDAGDGKTTVSSNLAIALSQIGRRVVIVDGDLRKPRLNQIFKVDAHKGLGKILENEDMLGKVPVSQFVSETKMPGLFILPTAATSDGIVPKLHSEALRKLLALLRAEFDVVIIDTPPMLQLSDARVLGSLADGIILVFKARKTTIDDAVAVYKCLHEDGIKVLGTVLNGWNRKKSPRYGPYSPALSAV